jgi:hypothetical protein
MFAELREIWRGFAGIFSKSRFAGSVCIAGCERLAQLPDYAARGAIPAPLARYLRLVSSVNALQRRLVELPNIRIRSLSNHETRLLRVRRGRLSLDNVRFGGPCMLPTSRWTSDRSSTRAGTGGTDRLRNRHRGGRPFCRSQTGQGLEGQLGRRRLRIPLFASERSSPATRRFFFLGALLDPAEREIARRATKLRLDLHFLSINSS